MEVILPLNAECGVIWFVYHQVSALPIMSSLLVLIPNSPTCMCHRDGWESLAASCALPCSFCVLPVATWPLLFIISLNSITTMGIWAHEKGRHYTADCNWPSCLLLSTLPVPSPLLSSLLSFFFSRQNLINAFGYLSLPLALTSIMSTVFQTNVFFFSKKNSVEYNFLHSISLSYKN